MQVRGERKGTVDFLRQMVEEILPACATVPLPHEFILLFIKCPRISMPSDFKRQIDLVEDLKSQAPDDDLKFLNKMFVLTLKYCFFDLINSFNK